MENSKELFESIFNRNLWNTDTGDYLENIAGEHPYFSIAQFYLLLQTEKDNPAYKKQVQKTAALLNNNYWLNYLITTSSIPEPIFVQPAFEPEETIADIKKAFSSETEIGPEAVKIPETTPIHPLTTDGTVENEIINYESVVENPIAEEEVVENTDNKYSVSPPEDLLLLTKEANTENEVVSYQPVTVQEEVAPAEENVSLKNDEQAAISEEATSNNFNKAIDENIGNLIPESDDKTDETASVISENEITIENKAAEDLVTAAPFADKNDNEKNSTVACPSSDTLLFQPLHTSDYFASVGIKLSEEANGSDRLGKQLKSFTQWLKTMKKIDTRNAEPLLPSEITPENADNNIQLLAEKSNKEDEIITEAMADVLVQQGRINKAVEVLKKLSLLNPSKSTYFAAKIEQLKD